jgi:hypothetical protein
MWNGRFRYSELQRRLNIILSILSEASGRTHLGQRGIRLCLFGCIFPFFLFLHTLYVTSSHVFCGSWWHIVESFPFGGDFSLEGVHGRWCAHSCVKKMRLPKQSPNLFASSYSELLLQHHQHHHNVRRRRRSEVRPRQKVTILRKVSNLCFCAANSFFRPLGLMVRGYATSLRFAWSLTTLPYSPLPLHQSDEALVGHALFWKIQPSPDSNAKFPKLHGLLQMYLG